MKLGNTGVRRFVCVAAITGCMCVAMGGLGLATQASTTAVASETASAQQTQRSVNVNATDSVKVQPDMAELSLTIEPQADTADEARQTAADELQKLTEGLTALGIDAANVTSTQVSISARYDWSQSTETIVGYTASLSVTVKELTLDQASSAVTAAASVSDTTVGGVSYYVSNYDEMYQQALVSAMQAAKTKADVLAQAAGASVGQVLTVQEGSDSQQYRSQSNGLAETAVVAYDSSSASTEAATGSDIVLNPGTVEICASVTVSYELV